MTKLAILGARGHGKVVADCAESCGWEEIIFFDDDWVSLSKSTYHWPVVGTFQMLLNSLSDFDGVAIAIGNNRIRYNKYSKLSMSGASQVTLIHPAAHVSRYASIGEGSVILAGAIVNADASIGCANIVNTGASVDHDCSLGVAVHVSPGARLAGEVTVGDRSWIGIGASARQLVNIGSDVIIGAGAAVISDVPSGHTALGVPAAHR